MKIEFFNNAGVVNLKGELETIAKTCKSFNIASAFITNEAITVLKTFLNSNRNSLRAGRLITGLYQCFNSKETLLELERISKLSKGCVLKTTEGNYFVAYRSLSRTRKETLEIKSMLQEMELIIGHVVILIKS